MSTYECVRCGALHDHSDDVYAALSAQRGHVWLCRSRVDCDRTVEQQASDAGLAAYDEAKRLAQQ